MTKEKNIWKTIGIVCIVLLVLETLFIIYLFDLGNEMIEQENECIVNVCRDYDAFYYDEVDELCYCFNDGEESASYEEYLGGK